ncbi:MAG: DNA primase DnaG [Methanomassiliicoccaceae archaeon]|nr:DNA primase DnaG [Methanomassiliicoccaceae archaeon]
MNIDPNTTKYMIKARLTADGIVEKPDVVGAIFGQTEGLLGEELDLRDLQKSGRIGRIEVEVNSKGGKSDGLVYISSSLDQVETVVLASALETIDRVGPCKASIKVLGIEDVRVSKREKVIDRAKELLNDLIKQSKSTSSDLTDNIRQSIQVEEITSYGKDKCPAGPNVKSSEAIIVVEGRSDVLNLLKAGIKNAIAVEGTNIPQTVQELSKEKVVTAFVDGDRGGELILRELFQVAEIDYVARAPRAHEVEELSTKQIVKCLRNKVPGDQYMEMNGLAEPDDGDEKRSHHDRGGRDERQQRRNDDDDGDERRERREERHDRNGREERPQRRNDDDDGDERRERREERHDRNGREDRGRRELRERRPKEERFNTEAAERYKKKAVAPEEEPDTETEAEEDVPKVQERQLRSNDKEEKKTTRMPRGRKDAVKQPKTLSPEQEALRDMLLEMASTHNAKILNSDNDTIKEVAVKELVESLKENSEGISKIVFDGVISQRILDISADRGVNTVVGTRKGNITKMPAGITIWTKDDLY